MLNGAPEYSSASDYFSDHLDAATAVSKRNKNKRRFSDDQIRSLEIIFESDTKIEPRKKTQLAKELGLQPRQVAIWFQNRRARWKSKQIEKDYGVLLADFNDLASRFESLNKEKQSLLIQLQKLKSVKKDDIQNQETDGESDYTKMKSELKNIPTKSLDGAGILSSDDDSSIMAEAAIFGLDEENEALKRVESSSEDWGSLDSDDPINQLTESCQWWDFWC